MPTKSTKSTGKKIHTAVRHRKPIRGGADEYPPPLSSVPLPSASSPVSPSERINIPNLKSVLMQPRSGINSYGSDDYDYRGYNAIDNSAGRGTYSADTIDKSPLLRSVSEGSLPPQRSPYMLGLKESAIEMMMNDKGMPERMKGIKDQIKAMLDDVIAGKSREEIDFSIFMPFYQKYLVDGDDNKVKTMYVKDMYDFIVENVYSTDRSFGLCKLSRTLQRDLQNVYTVQQLDKLLSRVRDQAIKVLEVSSEAQKRAMEGGGGGRKKARRTASSAKKAKQAAHKKAPKK